MVFPRQDATIIIHTGFRNANHNVIRLVPKLTTIKIVCIIARTTTGNHETAKIQLDIGVDVIVEQKKLFLQIHLIMENRAQNLVVVFVMKNCMKEQRMANPVANS